MKLTMKRIITVVMLMAVLLTNVSLTSAVTSDWVFYGDYTDVTTLYNYSGSYPSMQGLAVGSQYLYAIKINSDDSLATIAMVDKDTGSTTWLKDSSDGSVLFSGFDHANDMAVWGIDGASHLFIATTKQGANAIWRLERDGSYLTRVTSYHLQCNGEDICATAMDVMNVDSSGYIHFITKWGQDIYTGKVHKDTMNATIAMTKICTISKDMAYIKGEKLNLSDWVNQGFGYYDNTLFVPLSGPDGQLQRSVVLVYNLDNVPQGATIYPTDYLNFRVTSGAYSALFEIESVDICSADKKLYFNTNRRVTDSNTNHDGISSFDGYTYTKPTAASFDAIKHFNAEFLPNGGTGTMAVQRINNGIATKLSKNQFTKPGYTFAGWTAHRLAQNQWYYTNGSSTGWYAEGSQPSGYYLYTYRDQQSVAATSNVHGDTVEFNATWTAAQYTAKFDANGGSGTAMADMSFDAGDTGKLPASSFQKEGHTFAGWQVSGLSDVLQPGTSVSQLVDYIGKGSNTGNTVTLLAKWEANDYTVTWKVDGTKYTTTTVKYGQAITAPSYTAPEGYTFSGWTVPATMPAKDITLDATLSQKSYTVTWQVDGKVTKETYAYGAYPSYKGSTEKAADGCTIYYFTGWNKSIAEVTGDVTYIAQFTPGVKHTGIVNDAAVAPTCTNPGLTEGSHCAACGTVIVKQEIILANGHSAPEYINDGATHSGVYPCCGATHVTGEAHTYYDGKCVCGALEEQTVAIPTITLKYPSLSFESEVFYNVYFTVADAEVKVEDLGLLTWYNRPANTASATYESAEAVIPGATYNAAGDVYMVRSEGVPAKQLGDNVYLRVYAKLSDGTYAYSPVTYYNAKMYASDILANSQSAEMKSLVVAMLNYGAAAQVHFDHNTDSLMNAGLTAEQKALVKAYSSDMIGAVVSADSNKVGTFKSNGGFSNGYPSVSFEGAFAINYYLIPKQAVEGDMTLYCWDLSTYNSVSTLTEENATAKITMTKGSSLYVGAYDGIAAKQIDETVFVAGVYTANGVRYSSPVISYSLGAYCADQIANGSDTMKAFAAETAVYGHYAKAYFASLEG